MIAFKTADILLPKLDAEGMSRWSVVACDQYTSEPDYWKKTAELVGDFPSTLKLILPEIFLGEPDRGERIARINETMRSYLDNHLFNLHKDCFILTNRTQSDGRSRLGIVGAVDLEQYDYSKGSRSQVRATEATVAERIPPRVKIRMDAPLELPHIMILIDDPERTVIEPLLSEKLQRVYDFELMQNGGHLTGDIVCGEAASRVIEALEKLREKELAKQNVNAAEGEPLVFAMGDGNHSLATAKACYEEKKRSNSPDAELARYALVEIVNLHSKALEFEAIHRVITETNADDLLCKMTKALELTESGSADGQKFTFVTKNGARELYIGKPSSNLTVGTVQKFLDEYLAENAGKIDYIHGEEVVKSLCERPDAAGILLPPLRKDELFPTVVKDGALPRKTFSMGHANDKRFYCEARIIKK